MRARTEREEIKVTRQEVALMLWLICGLEKGEKHKRNVQRQKWQVYTWGTDLITSTNDQFWVSYYKISDNPKASKDQEAPQVFIQTEG